MKKVILLMLVAIVPLLTMAQKRSKKNKKSDKTATYDFMVITGYQVVVNSRAEQDPGKSPTPHMRTKNLMSSNSKVRVQFDLAKEFKAEQIQLNESSHRTMVDAVAAAAENGWEFQSADVVPVGQSKIYYYYMRRDK